LFPPIAKIEEGTFAGVVFFRWLLFALFIWYKFFKFL